MAPGRAARDSNRLPPPNWQSTRGGRFAREVRAAGRAPEGNGRAPMLSLMQEVATDCDASSNKRASQELEKECKQGTAKDRTGKCEALANEVQTRTRRLWFP